MRRTWLFTASVAAFVAVAHPARADQTLTFDGNVPTDGPEHFFVPFDVPAGTQEIEILHDDQSEANILDFGLNDPAGYRGWGGGTTEDAIVGVSAASRAYVPGPIPAGTWNVIVGKAKIVASPATYHIVVTLRTTPTLAPQTDRKAYVPAAALSSERRYYAVDFHVHDRESTDAKPTLEENIQYAESVGLDAIEASDHNTITQMDYFTDLQAKHPKLLIIPGIEWTTYHGHGNAIGATAWVDHKIGQPNVTVNSAVDAIHAQNALFAVNHPALEIGDLCIGCAWTYTPELPATKIDAFEVESGGYAQAGFAFTSTALYMWDQLLNDPAHPHIAAIGGSDDHKGGDDSGQFESAIGNPTTYVMADELSVAGIMAGVKAGRTYVKMQDSHDPDVELTSEVAPDDTSTVAAKSTILTATIRGGQHDGTTVHFKKNGDDFADEIAVTSDPFTFSINVTPPPQGEDRYRVELLQDEKPRVETSHLYVKYDANGPDPVAAASGDDGGCSASPSRSEGAFGASLFVGAVALVGFRRRRSAKR